MGEGYDLTIPALHQNAWYRLSLAISRTAFSAYVTTFEGNTFGSGEIAFGADSRTERCVMLGAISSVELHNEGIRTSVWFDDLRVEAEPGIYAPSPYHIPVLGEDVIVSGQDARGDVPPTVVPVGGLGEINCIRIATGAITLHPAGVGSNKPLIEIGPNGSGHAIDGYVSC